MSTKFSAFAAASALAATDILVGLQGGANVKATMAQVKTFTNTNITLAAGQAGVGLAPLYFVSGTSLATPVAGAMEFTTDTLSFTITTGAARKTVALLDAIGINQVAFGNASGTRLNAASTFTWDNTNQRLTISNSQPGQFLGYITTNTSGTAGSSAGIQINNNTPSLLRLEKLGTSWGTSGLLTNDMGWFSNATAATLYSNLAAAAHIWSIGGFAATNQIFSLTGDPSANSGAIAAVKTNNTGTGAVAAFSVNTTTGEAGFISAAGSGFTTAGVFSANSLNVSAALQNLYLLASTTDKTVNVVTNGTAAANIVATFAGGGTITASAPMLTLAQTWNNAGVTFVGVVQDVTNTASAAASRLHDWRVGGTTKISFDVSGNVYLANNAQIQSVSGGTTLDIGVNNTQLLRLTNGTHTFYVSSVAQAFANGSGWTANSRLNIGASSDVIMTRSAAAVLQHGAANAASPVAQTVQAQGSRSGTDSNVAGASLTIRPGAGTGDATPGALILQSYVAVASGTGAQTATDTLTLNSGNAVFAGSVDAASYKVGGVAGADFGPGAVASITVVKGIVTAIS